MCRHANGDELPKGECDAIVNIIASTLRITSGVAENAENDDMVVHADYFYADYYAESTVYDDTVYASSGEVRQRTKRISARLARRN